VSLDDFLVLGFVVVASFVLISRQSASAAAYAGTDVSVASDDDDDTGDGTDDGDDSGTDAGDDGGDDASDAAMPTGDLLILAQTMRAEAAPGDAAQLQGVASVILNRHADIRFVLEFTIGMICKQKSQFSCWTNSATLALIARSNMSDPNFVLAVQLAQQAMAGQLPDNTGGAEFYHDTSIATPASWASLVQTVQIGSLIFFKEPAL
jgi:N-acetylmuramoyl-L-alanine amidase